VFAGTVERPVARSCHDHYRARLDGAGRGEALITGGPEMGALVTAVRLRVLRGTCCLSKCTKTG
jgi:hypothetical protein